MKSIEYKLLLAIGPMLLLAITGKSLLTAQRKVDDCKFVSGRIVAVGIPGASAVSAGILRCFSNYWWDRLPTTISYRRPPARREWAE